MEQIEKAIRWFENIADECDKLTSGNVAHLRAQIKGMAIRSVEYLTKRSQEPASEDLEKELSKFLFQYFGTRYDDEKKIELSAFDITSIAKHFAQWQREQIMKDDKFLIAIGDAYVDWIDGGINTNDEDSADYIRKNMIYERQ